MKKTDITIKLAQGVKADPAKVMELLERTATPCAVSDEAAEKLSKAIEVKPEFIAAQADKFGIDVERVAAIAQSVVDEEGPPLVVEQREFSVDSDVKMAFRDLYQREVLRRRTCSYQVRTGYTSPTGKESSVWKECGEELESIEQLLVHHSLHLMLDSGDPRTQRAMLIDVRELLHPIQEKSIRAALGPDERHEYRDSLERHRARMRD